MEIKPPTERNQEWQRLPRGDTERHKAIISKALPIITDNVAELEYVDLIDRTASQLGRRDTRNSNNTPTKVPKSTLEKGNLRQQALARKETAPAKPQRPQSQHLAGETPFQYRILKTFFSLFHFVEQKKVWKYLVKTRLFYCNYRLEVAFDG